MDREHVIELKKQLTERGSSFADGFYKFLFESSPQLAKMFRNTNLKEQKIRLIEGLIETLNLLNDPQEFNDYLENLGVRHIAYEVEAGHYPIVKDALIYALKELKVLPLEECVKFTDIIVSSMLSGVCHAEEAVYRE